MVINDNKLIYNEPNNEIKTSNFQSSIPHEKNSAIAYMSYLHSL